MILQTLTLLDPPREDLNDRQTKKLTWRAILLKVILWDWRYKTRGCPEMTSTIGGGGSEQASEQVMTHYNMVVFRVGENESRVSTVVIRGATDNYMDDIERAVDDGVNVFKGADGRARG